MGLLFKSCTLVLFDVVWESQTLYNHERCWMPVSFESTTYLHLTVKAQLEYGIAVPVTVVQISTLRPTVW